MHTIQLKPMIKAQISGRMASIGISDVVTTSVYLEITHLWKLMKIIIIIIRECGSTLYIGMARTSPPTNTKFRLTFLLTRLQKALYEDLSV